MSGDVTALGVGELARRYRDGTLDPLLVTKGYLDKIDSHRHAGTIYRVVTGERACRQALAAKRLFDDGIDLGPLRVCR